jgi:SAM-dependent methyltransferase/uncharacterized protein YbaR (Trm112 family)
MNLSNKILSIGLVCPYCKNELKIDKSLRYIPGSYGVLACSCDRYPVVDNIVYLKKFDGRKHIECDNFIEEGRFNLARWVLFDGPFFLRQYFRMIDILFSIVPVFRPELKTVLDLAAYLSPSGGDWFKYLKERTGRITYILSLATVSQIRSKQTVVDAGCGLGHFLSVSCSQIPGANYIGIDTLFMVLYLARRYIIPEHIPLICTDLNDGMPFAGESVDRIYFNDSFMYIKRQNKLMSEVVRSLCKSGMAFFNHVHNRYAKNAGQGFGVTLQDMAGYAGKTPLLYASDTEMAGNIFNKNHIVYHRLVGNEYEHGFRSYSYLLTKLRLNKYEFKLKKQLQSLVRINTDSDPEDTELTESMNL